MAKGCRTGPPTYVALRAGTKTLCRSRLNPLSQGLLSEPRSRSKIITLIDTVHLIPLRKPLLIRVLEKESISFEPQSTH
jgi:hypothetical protein